MLFHFAHAGKHNPAPAGISFGLSPAAGGGGGVLQPRHLLGELEAKLCRLVFRQAPGQREDQLVERRMLTVPRQRARRASARLFCSRARTRPDRERAASSLGRTEPPSPSRVRRSGCLIRDRGQPPGQESRTRFSTAEWLHASLQSPQITVCSLSVHAKNGRGP